MSRNEISAYEQKPIKICDFNKAGEKEIKERVEKRKIKRREVDENNTLKKKKKQEEDKEMKLKCWLDQQN